MKKIIISICLLSSGIVSAQLQWQKGGNSALPFGFPPTIGTNWNAPFQLMTIGTIRMHINQNSTFANGTNSGGFIGVGTLNPFSPLHVVGNQTANAQGWNRGITLSNDALLQWDAGGESGFFMAHPSSSPNGNWYAGQNSNQTPTSPVDYAFSVYVNDNLGTVNPLRSTQFFKNLLVQQTGFGRRFGVNTLNPQLAAEVYSNTTQMRLSYGAAVSTTTVPTVFTDLQTNASGNLQIMPTGGRVGVNLTTNPTANLDVNGNARIRNVPASTPDALFVGVRNGGNSNDLSVRRLDFTGNAGQVLLGNGTWGTAPGAITANNGLVVAGGNVQLGAQCNNFLQLLTSSFTQSRAIFLNGNSFWMFSGANQNGGVGFGAQPASAGLCGVGNTVEISANLQSAYGNADASGLRLTKLTSASPIVANGTNGVDNSKVLSVDQNGDVVLTDASAGTINGAHNGTSASLFDLNKIALGQDLNDPLNPGILLNDREVPMNGNDILFTQDGRIGMGTLFSTPIVAISKIGCTSDTSR